MAHFFHSHIFPESENASHYCFFLLRYAKLANFFKAFIRMPKSKISKQLYEEPNGKLVSSCNFVSSDSIWFINLTNSLEYKRPAAVCQISCLAQSRRWVHTPWLPIAQNLSLLASILCQGLKIASWPSAE